MDKLTSPIPTSIKYKGVRLRKWGKYVSEIRLPNSRERIWLGSYDTAEKAARAFDAAQFCLRGLDANFNFPDDPPRIAAGQGLSPAEIQSLAQQHGNSYQRERAPEGTSNPEGAAGSIDWSFLDMLDNNAGHDPNFGLFHEPGDMHMPPHYDHDSIFDEDNNYDHVHGGNGQSFLWNF